jgi:hypothetical protein
MAIDKINKQLVILEDFVEVDALKIESARKYIEIIESDDGFEDYIKYNNSYDDRFTG